MENNLIYPHRIYFGKYKCMCDICKENNATKIINVDFHPYLGILSCQNTNCIKKSKDFLKKTTINYNTLIKKYGEKVNVKRSNGNTENDWEIYGSAFKEEKDGPFWLNVKKMDKSSSKTIAKTIRLEDFEKWN